MAISLLDPDGAGGTYKLVGGRISLDFLNTVSWPGRRREHEWMDSPENWIRWNQLVGRIDPQTADRLRVAAGDAARDASLVARVREIRRLIARALTPLAHDKSPAPEDVARIGDLVRQAMAFRQIDPETLSWSWKPVEGLEDLIWPVIYDAGELLTSEPAERRRIGFCPECSWMFFDTSKNRRRRWCDMADCGSRSKARAYYRRSRQKRGGP